MEPISLLAVVLLFFGFCEGAMLYARSVAKDILAAS